MELLSFAIEIYFVIILGVSGFAKIDNSQYFATILRQQRILPSRSVSIASRVLPWVEIIISLLLIVNVLEVATAILVLALFSLFLALKIFLLITKRTTDCGCYGEANPQKIDGVSVIVSIILVLLSGLHLWLVIHGALVSWQWRLIGDALFIGGGCFILRKIIIRHRIRPSLNIEQRSDIGGIEVGERVPAFVATDQYGRTSHLDDFRGQRYLLIFVMPGCPACPAAIEALNDILQDEQGLMALVVGGPDAERNRSYAIEHNIRLRLLTTDPDLVEKQYQVRGFPLVFVVDEASIIRAKGVVNTSEHLRELLTIAYVGPSIHR